MTRDSQPSWLTPYEPTCAAIAALLHPYAEVVVHDVLTDRVAAIWNPFSRREVGDPSLLGTLPQAGNGTEMVMGPYGKVLTDGRKITSVSAVLFDSQGDQRGLLCVNFDRTSLDDAVEMLGRFACPVSPRPSELFERDWREQIALVVDEECRARHYVRGLLTREERLAVVRALDSRGLFSTRHAVSHVARALRVSRATVYKMRKEVRSESATQHSHCCAADWTAAESQRLREQ